MSTSVINRGRSSQYAWWTILSIMAGVLAGYPTFFQGAQAQNAKADMKAYEEKFSNSQVKFTMLPIPGGEFQMGSPESEKGRNADEGPSTR